MRDSLGVTLVLLGDDVLKLFDLIFQSHIGSLQISNVLVLRFHPADLVSVEVRERNRVLEDVLLVLLVHGEEGLRSCSEVCIPCVKVLLYHYLVIWWTYLVALG